MDIATLQHLAQGDVADFTWEAPVGFTAEHARLSLAAIRAHQDGDPEAGEQFWQHAQALWSRAWSANHQALGLLQAAGLTRFSPVKPQRWVIASFEHHNGPHGVSHPHIHNIVIPALTTDRAELWLNSGAGNRLRRHAMPTVTTTAEPPFGCRQHTFRATPDLSLPPETNRQTPSSRGQDAADCRSAAGALRHGDERRRTEILGRHLPEHLFAQLMVQTHPYALERVDDMVRVLPVLWG